MKQVTATGQTVDAAVDSALKQLNITKDKADIKIIDSGKRGIFGIFGAKPASVEVSIIPEDPIIEAEKFLRNVIKQMGINASIDVNKYEKEVLFQLSGEKIAILIGKRGKTLNSLQFLTQLVANRYSDQFLNIVVDAENYRGRRKETLEQLSKRLADKAIRTNKEVLLEPMPSYERKIIHNVLYKNKSVSTISDGVEPNRYIVIKPNKK